MILLLTLMNIMLWKLGQRVIILYKQMHIDIFTRTQTQQLSIQKQSDLQKTLCRDNGRQQQKNKNSMHIYS